MQRETAQCRAVFRCFHTIRVETRLAGWGGRIRNYAEAKNGQHRKVRRLVTIGHEFSVLMLRSSYE